ncbi:MAG: hypothetical protein IPI60_16615 [Saprospiraceae bacterium]|nr:hypothetical protein [Saprospiraceae bacterium]
MIDGQNTAVPVRTLGFQNIGSFQFTIKIEPVCIQIISTGYYRYRQYTSGTCFNSFEIDPTGQFVTFTWFTATSLSVANATKLFDVVVAGAGVWSTKLLLRILKF